MSTQVVPQEHSLAQRALSALPWVLIGLALAAFIGYLLVYFNYAWQLFKFPFDYDQGEGFELVDTLLFSQGQWPYRNIDSYPFYSSNYPPLFHLMTVPLVWLFGPRYWTGRLVSFLGTIVTAGAIGYAVQRQGKRWWLSLLSGLAFLASNYVYHVGPLFRQHMTMVMFETLAVVLMTVTIDLEEADGKKRPWHIAAVLLLLLAAGYTKQLAYATVAAVFIFFFLRQTWRAVKWAIPFAIITGLIFLWIDYATHGNWMLNTVTANINPFVPGQAQGLYRQWFQLHIVLAIVASLYAVYQLYFERLSLYSIWFVVALINSVTAGKWGAGESYFATAIAASCILTGLAFSRLLGWSELRGWAWRAASLTLIGLLFLIQANRFFHLPTASPALATVADMLGRPTSVMIAPQTSCSAPRDAELIPYVDDAGVSLLGRPPSPEDSAAGRKIVSFIAEGETATFGEDAGFNLYLERDVITNPTQLLNLYNNNAVDLTEMLGMLDRQEFDTVVLRAQFYPPPVLETIGQRYQTEELVQMNGFVYCVMRPRD